MDKKELLRSIGFTEYEISTIISLIKLKIVTTKEISFDSGVPQNKLYNILKKFENLNILSTIPAATKKFKLINLKSYIDKRIKEKESKLKRIKKSASEFEDIDDIEDFVFSLIKGQKAIMNKLAENTPKVKKEILAVQRSWKLWGEGIQSMKDCIERGVEVKMIGMIEKHNEKKVSEWKKIGCKIKKYNQKFGEYPLRFTIFDNKEARITIGKPEISDPKDYITIWTKSKPLINTLRSQFMEMWKESKKF